MKNINDESQPNYRAECEGHLAALEKDLLALELSGTEVDAALVARMPRSAHAVRVGAAILGLEQTAELAHRTEKTLALLRLSRAAPEPERVTVLLRAIDALRLSIEDPGAGAEGSEIAGALAALANGSTPGVRPRAADWRLRTLLVEDDFTGRLLLQTFLSRYGDCHIAVNGREAVEAVRTALESGQGYDLICMDIMMPEMDGGEAVRRIRGMEEEKGILSTEGSKIIMTTAVNDLKEVSRSFWDLCDSYLVKPVDLAQLLRHMKSYDLLA